MRVLVAGWFSFENCGATAGDLIARDQVCEWLASAGIPYDTAVVAPFPGDVNWMEVEPTRYSHLVFVCGPFVNLPPGTDLLARFPHCRYIGVNLSMVAALNEFNPFHVLFERDSDRATRPDLTFLAPPLRAPVIGRILVHPQHEYGSRALHKKANAAIAALLESRDVAVVNIDTAIEWNAGGLRTAAQIEALIGRMDAVVTTRLHGTVLALKSGVPPLVIDPIAGGAKIARQVATIGWRHAFTADALDEGELQQSLDYCLTAAARDEARECARRAAEALSGIQAGFIEAIR